ncbi:MAG: prolyl oligopeptidase family serine peptidase [Pseudomonadota bacterium]
MKWYRKYSKCRLTNGVKLLVATIFVFVLPVAAVAQPFEIEELLGLPHVQRYIGSAAGDVAWVERSGPSFAIHVARAPGYDREELISFDEDTGQPISLIGFGPDSEVLFVRGKPGFNPAHTPLPKPLALLSISEGKTSANVVLDDMSLGFSSPLVSADQQTMYFAGGSAVYQLELQGKGKPKPLFQVRGRVADLIESPDLGKLAFISDRSLYERGKYSFVGVFDLSKNTITYMSPGLGFDQDIVWSPDSTQLAFVRFAYEPKTWRFSNHREGAPFDIVVADVASGEGRAVFTSVPGYGARFNGFSSSGYTGLGGSGSLLWLSNGTLLFPYEKTGWKHIYAVPSTGGDALQITKGEFEVHAILSSFDRDTAYFLSNSEEDLARLGLYKLDIANGLSPTRVRFDEAGGMPSSLGALPGGKLLYEFAGGQSPSRLVLRHQDGAERQLSSGPRPESPITERLPAPEVIEFKARDGVRLQAVLYRPANELEGSKHPVVVHSHGGSRYQTRPVWQLGFGYRTVLRYLASKGYYVVSVNFRSGTGYGLDFREPESYGGRGAGDAFDFIDTAKYLAMSVPEIDPDRMAIFGHSYGGHNVTNVLARSDVYAAGITSAGVGDWVVEMEKDFREVLPFNVPQRVMLEKLAYESSAISQIDKWGDEPLLILHGDNDPSAAMQQSLELYHALRRRGIETEAEIFPGEDHGIKRYQSQVRYLEAIDTFLQKHLGPIE